MNWYEDDVRALEIKKKSLPYQPKTVFYGSSSIRLWETIYNDFSDLLPVNLGFGGSTLAACAWFFDRAFAELQPESVVLYAGDNDLGDGRHPEEIYLFYKQLVAQIRLRFGNVPITFISIKPSISRFNILDKIRYTNKLIEGETASDSNQFYLDIYNLMIDEKCFPERRFFQPDGLHLSAEGYTLWTQLLKKHYLTKIQGR